VQVQFYPIALSFKFGAQVAIVQAQVAQLYLQPISQGDSSPSPAAQGGGKIAHEILQIQGVRMAGQLHGTHFVEQLLVSSWGNGDSHGRARFSQT
jgi:hypothetical protein